MANLYEDSINEYTDWITGENSVTGDNDTGGLEVSGGSIRELLMSKLQIPFIVYEDTANSLYKFFSSTTSRDLYLSDSDTYSDLLLFSCVKASDYEITTDIDTTTVYLNSGDDTQSDATVSFTWSITKGSSSVTDSVTIVFTITDEDGNTQTVSKVYDSSVTSVSINLFDYYADGTNTVNMKITGTDTGAESSSTFTVVLLTLDLESDFKFNAEHSSGSDIDVPYTLTRNITSIATSIMFYIDGSEATDGKVDIAANAGDTEYESTFTITDDLDSGQHTLQIWATIEYNSKTFRSNICFFTFEVASSSTTLDYFINVKTSFSGVIPPISSLYLTATQYEAYTLEWGYYTDNLLSDTSISVTWYLEYGDEQIELNTINAVSGQQSSDLIFSPTVYTDDEDIYLVAYYDDEELVSIPITIDESDLSVSETTGYDFKLRADSKLNDSDTADTWEYGDYSTTFTGVSWNSTTGWYDGSLRLVGEDAYAVIDYAPLSGTPSDGRSIEIEFMSEKVNSDDDVIITIGGDSGGLIEVTTNSATAYDSSGNEIVKTNFKSGEQIKLCFIFNEDSDDDDSNLAYIVNNGILERAESYAGLIIANDTDTIKIGGSASGVRFFGIRVYDSAITYSDEYNNYVYDSDDKSTIISNNNVTDESVIDYDLCCNKLATFLIEGDLSNILDSTTDKDESETTVNITYVNPDDSTKNFTLTNGKARKHGQSTLNYPITSIKFWTNKNTDDSDITFTCSGQTSEGYAKNRYKMKDTSIPANKFILQANYADSSGVRNGGFQRLIQSSWYSATIDDEYKLRTIPQLFSTNEVVNHDNTDINEDSSVDGYNDDSKQWGDYFDDDFPYTLRISPDSIPCVVFYKDTSSDTATTTFLGQYVFMEDKKSDFCYGERSIYKADADDPFCLTTTNKDNDTSDNKIWDNTNVLRMECLTVNSEVSSFMSSDGISDIVYDDDGNADSYGIEADFELIYPDPDDLEGSSSKGTDKFGTNSKFLKKIQPFLDFHTWITGTYNDQDTFESEAASHLDLYKLAAYYIIFIRGGLVDSVERNAQYKTYDGTHWHIEPWDMDIALGDKNTGGIAFDPPMDRDTTLSTDSNTYAYSGRSSSTSNWLWDALEAWDEWSTVIVPEVAQALYTAGFTYDAITEMFDENYAEAWCETIYNESMYYKYIESAAGSTSWLAWLEGSGITYRHWWLSVSMDYWDAKWNCGDFKNHYVYFALDHDAGDTADVDVITITPSSKTYFNISRNYTETLATLYATPEDPATYDASEEAFATKEPLVIYGANYIESLDMQCFSTGLDTINLAGSYSDTLGASIKELLLGSVVTKSSDYIYTGVVSGRSDISLSATDSDDNDALAALETFNIRGLQPYTSFYEFYSLDRSNLKNVYAMGSGLTTFYSSQSGNVFSELELPGITTDVDGDTAHSLTTIYMVDSTWDSITFWDTTIDDSDNNATFTMCNVDSDYTLNIPSSLKSMTLLGTTCATENSKDLVLEWINTLVALGETIGDYSLKLSDIDWSSSTCDTLLTYDELALLAEFNDGDNASTDSSGEYNLAGYIMIDNGDDELTSEQLTQIKAWFGDTVFTKNSAGLVIDHELTYIQISVGSDAYITDSEIYLDEGNSCSLTATKFALASTDDDEYNWFVREPNSDDTGQSYKKVYLSEGDDGVMYLYADESTYGDYDVEVLCTSSTTSLNSTVTIHVQGVTYPDSYTYNASNSNMRTYNGAYAFYKSSMTCEFYVTTTDSYTATVDTTTYTLTDSDGNVLLDDVSCDDLSSGTGSAISLDDYLAYIAQSDTDCAITLYSEAVDSDAVHYYTLTCTISFESGKTISTSTQILIIDDKIAIIANDASVLYEVITQKYASLNDGDTLSSYYKTDLMGLTGTLDFTTDPVSGDAESDWLEITSVKTQDARSIFKYLPNITEVILDGTAITSTNDDITYDGDSTSQLVFDEMTNLETLSIQNCTALTDDVDLTDTTTLTILLATGTTINFTFPESPIISDLELGTPTSIELVTPTVLTADEVTVEDSDSLDSIDITNMPDVDTYATFAKIMNL